MGITDSIISEVIKNLERKPYMIVHFLIALIVAILILQLHALLNTLFHIPKVYFLLTLSFFDLCVITYNVFLWDNFLLNIQRGLLDCNECFTDIAKAFVQAFRRLYQLEYFKNLAKKDKIRKSLFTLILTYYLFLCCSILIVIETSVVLFNTNPIDLFISRLSAPIATLFLLFNALMLTILINVIIANRNRNTGATSSQSSIHSLINIIIAMTLTYWTIEKIKPIWERLKRIAKTFDASPKYTGYGDTLIRILVFVLIRLIYIAASIPLLTTQTRILVYDYLEIISVKGDLRDELKGMIEASNEREKLEFILQPLEDKDNCKCLNCIDFPTLDDCCWYKLYKVNYSREGLSKKAIGYVGIVCERGSVLLPATKSGTRVKRFNKIYICALGTEEVYEFTYFIRLKYMPLTVQNIVPSDSYDNRSRK